MCVYAPIAVASKQDQDAFEFRPDGSCVYTPVGVAPNAPIRVNVVFDRKNSYITPYEEQTHTGTRQES